MRGRTVAAVVVLALGVAFWWGPGRRKSRPEEARPAAAPVPAAPAPVAKKPPEHAAPYPSRADRAEKDPPSEGDAPSELEEPGRSWESVDLDAVRAAMPDNTYWTMSAPTKDPDVLRAREEERERWNTEYGKVLSNTATAEEIEAYYAHRRRISLDYVEFATHLLSHYSTVLPHRDIRLLQLAIQMHLARLEEIPRQITEAHERREAHDAARRAWLAEQKTFEPDAPDPP
jgi:hypothetical protein